MTNYPNGWRGWRICVSALMVAAGLAAPVRVDAQVTAYAYVLLPDNHQLVVIDTRTNTVVGTPIAVGTST